MCLHAIGAHWTYSLVPYDEAFVTLTGHSFDAWMGWERNHYDRFVHLAYGLLLAYPIRELFLRVAEAKGFWGYFLPVVLTMAASMFYELIEWAAAEVFGGDLGIAFVGAQGDVWDAQKDMSLATVGRSHCHGRHRLHQHQSAERFCPGVVGESAGQAAKTAGRGRNRATAQRQE